MLCSHDAVFIHYDRVADRLAPAGNGCFRALSISDLWAKERTANDERRAGILSEMRDPLTVQVSITSFAKR